MLCMPPSICVHHDLNPESAGRARPTTTLPSRSFSLHRMPCPVMLGDQLTIIAEWQAVLTVSCTQCAAKLRVPEESRAATVKCARCGKIFSLDAQSIANVEARATNEVASAVAQPQLTLSSPARGRVRSLQLGLAFLGGGSLVAILFLVAIALHPAAKTQLPDEAPSVVEQRLKDLEQENQRLNAELAKLKPAPEASETRPAEPVAADKAETVESNAESTAQARMKARIMETWGLANAVLEVKVTKIDMSGTYTRFAIVVTNKSKVSVSSCEISARTYDRAGKFLMNATTKLENIGPGGSADGSLLFSNVLPEDILQRKWGLEALTLENGTDFLFDAEKYLTLKEVQEGPLNKSTSPKG
jgi:hypothetical protein